MRSPPSTRAPHPPDTDLLLYDADCAFCRASAGWLARRARQRLALLSIAEAECAGVLTSLDDRERSASAHLVTASGIEYHGGAAITRALRLGWGGRAWALLDASGLAWMRDAGYALVVRSRGRIGWLARRLSREERSG
jgi:predicted DCC family thiol-disulfide oxidoreductase YuxK